ncbi:phage tail protein [Clostridium paraputrificum]|jgi:phage minor structural protein|nr:MULTISPECIES: phage tail spike protein [Clostridium]DAR10688.1 MAG TPA: tail protein [Caudoviricetes sp.]MDB2089453.1 phage tail protein [Clostridium paraputrificum]MDB2096389.1 phage tail protein [Clostridium paraputrificum]MDU1179941.1 phage tail spike protein [Clostridium sp.]MDU1226884.1 phage tail spike protein [Clostridium sp.]
MSIEFYNPDNNNFESDGNVTLRPNKALFKIRLNGICEIELSHPCDKEGRWKFIKNDGIIKAPTPYSTGQLFHVYSIKKNMVGGLNIKARHIFFDLNKSIILDNRAENKTCQEALDIILNETKFSGKSNIKKLATAYFVKMNRVAAINGNTDNTLISRWGGEIFLDNYNVTVNDHIGGDYGAYINYGNNMLELGLEDNEDNVITRGYPVAFNGRMLPEKYIDSPLINKYREIKEDFVEMCDLKLKEDSSDGEGFDTVEELYKSMRIRMKELYDGGLDKPTVTGTTKVAPLENTTKYKYVKGLVNIGLGDTITIYHEKLDIDFASRCIGYTWNILTRKYETVDVGEFKESFFSKQTDVRNKVESILNGDGSVKANEIQGFLDATRTKLIAQKEIGQLQDVRAFIWEDLDPNSPTYGCMIGGSAGIQISQQRTPDGKNWDFTTAITAEGLIADKIVGRLFSSKNGMTKIWMETGTFESELPDGSKIVISPEKGFYNKFGDSKREYHHLNYYDLRNIEVSNTGTWSLDITLPNEFKGKKFIADCNYKEILSSYPLTIFGNQRIYQDVDYEKGIIKLSGTIISQAIEFYTADNKTYLMSYKGNKKITAKISINVIA